jgi:hypothetical protein
MEDILNFVLPLAAKLMVNTSISSCQFISDDFNIQYYRDNWLLASIQEMRDWDIGWDTFYTG